VETGTAETREGTARGTKTATTGAIAESTKESKRKKFNMNRRKIMAKGQNNKKMSKKKPQKTMKEKKQAKRDKKNENISDL
jgi:hypothetical protein